MELGLSTSVLGSRALPDQLAVLAEYEVPWVEIHGYSVEEFDYTDRGLVTSTARALERLGPRLWSCHSPAYAPLDLASPDITLRTRSLTAIREAMSAARELRARVFVCDAEGQTWLADPRQRQVRRGLLADSLARLLQDAARLGLRLVIENHDGGAQFVTPADFSDLVGAFGLKGLGACWDTGHARLAGQPAEAACALERDLVTLHLHDNDGRRDLHRLPPEGGTVWEPLVHCLRRIGYQGPFMMELAPPQPLTPGGIRREVARAVEIYRRLVGRAGSGAK